MKCAKLLLLVTVMFCSLFAVKGFSSGLNDISLEKFKAMKADELEVIRPLLSVKKVSYVPYNPSEGKVYLIDMHQYANITPYKYPKVKFIGTHNLGTCVFLGIIARRNGKIVSVGVGHVDVITAVKSSVKSLLQTTIKNSDDDIEIVLISKDNPLRRARKILEAVYSYDRNLFRRAKFTVDLKAGSSVAINLRTGALSIDIKKDMNNVVFSNLDYLTYSTLVVASFYDGKEETVFK